MHPDGPNPAKLQTAPRTINPRRPLVLIHDGGGTTFAYFFLGNLKRDVWALHNPKYFTGEAWDGGMKEIARHYIDLISEAGIKGHILLGGWSLGGLLSVEMARMVADDPNSIFSIDGIVCIDAPFQLPREELPPTIDPDFTDLPELVQKAFENSDKALEKWQAPSWDGPALDGKHLKVTVAGKILDVGLGSVARKPVKGDWVLQDTPKFEHKESTTGGKTPPPAVLLKATERVNVPGASAAGCDLDTHRDEVLLGWGGRYPDFIKAEIDIASDHFDMFDKMNPSKTQTMTDQINVALGILDGILAQ